MRGEGWWPCGRRRVIARRLVLQRLPDSQLSCCAAAAPAHACWRAGRGECKLGFCKCYQGWFGHDCAYRMQGVEDMPGERSSSSAR